MRPCYIIGALRSPVTPRGGAQSELSLHALAAPVLRGLLAQANIAPEQVQELVLSNAMGGGGNPARLCALVAGLPVAGLSLDRQCVGGLDALRLGQALIASGQADLVVAGGAESYSRRPIRAWLHPDGREERYERPPFSPFAQSDPEMAEAAAALAEQLGISRAAQDAYAIASHAKALAARAALAQECSAGPLDPFARALAPRLAARAKVICGTITHANTAPAADGAAFCLLASARYAAKAPRAVEILAGQTLGADPAQPALAAVAAGQALLAVQGLEVAQIDQFELMEAYAAQAIATERLLGLPPERVNLKGGALARGHPIGASGAVLAVRLWHDLTAGAQGLALIAGAGGLGSALLLRAAS